MKMEESGPEAAKRQRLDPFGGSASHRMHQQQPEATLPLPLHSYPPGQALRPPSAYSQPPPPSPYNAAHEPRPLHDHPMHVNYDSHRSGFNTPVRDRPPPADTNPLHGVQPSSTHSPEERPLAALRPLNTAFESEGPHYPHGPPAEGPSPPPGYPVAETPNGNYHGLPMPIPSAHYDPSQGPPPVGSYPESSGSHGPPYSAGPYGPSPGAPWIRPYPPPKKGSRAQQACETCRQRKAKCDEGKPTCAYCKDTGSVCVYKEMQPAKADRAQKEIMDQLRKNEDNYDNLRTCFEKLDEKVDRVEKYLSDITRVVNFINKDIPDAKPSAHTYKRDDSQPPKQELPQAAPPDTAFSSPAQTRTGTNWGYSNPLDSNSIEDTPSGGISIHVDHTVAVHRLLSWRAVRELLAAKAPNENYVLDNEEKKGLLRVYGKGQGRDIYDGAQSGSPSSPASTASGEDSGRSPSNSSADDVMWGDYDLGYPNVVDGKFYYQEKDHLGGLTAQGNLKLDRATMSELLDSYLSNIHILHPFLDRVRLKRMVDKIGRNYNPNDPPYDLKSPFPAQNVSYPHHARPLKRKHSGGDSPGESSGTPTTASHQSSNPKLSRRISTVIVLLVMALGKICLHTDPLPGFAGDTAKDTSGLIQYNSPRSHTFSPSTNISSPMSTNEMRGVSGSSRGSTSEASNLRRMRKGDRNIDVIPGLAYFARATDILGGLQGNDLPFVQANLLAAIYVAQMGCVIESWTWIHHACRVCGFLVRDPSFERERDKTRVDLIRFAYLTCLQLESDILAELDLMPSGLQNIDPQNKISLPKDVVEDASEIAPQDTQKDSIMVFYSYQLSLRKLMNDWQKFLYPPGGSEAFERIFRPEDDKFAMRDRNACEQILTGLRDLIQRNPQVAWQDTDPPAEDINAARLRGKYYGAKYIVHRPFLYYALHHFNEKDLTPEVMRRFREYEKNPQNFHLEDQPPKDASKEERSTWVVFQMLMSCKQCVSAAKCSTRAFDGVLNKRRLMLTNIFGTAHAQFGNMLVLSATYQSKHLSWLITREDLLYLLNRTINFLSSLAPISTTLAVDALLLTHIRDKVDGGNRPLDFLRQTSSSFGSTAN